MNRNFLRVGWVLLLMIVWGCQSIMAPLGLQDSAESFVKKAQAYEKKGELVDALEQYKRAQTVDPNQQRINDRIAYLEKKLGDLAEAHYQAGLRFRDKGKWSLAKKEFLETLRYRPNYKNAAAMLQQRQPSEAGKFIIHKIEPGESISGLALKFYGDYKKYYHIANFNNLSNAAQVRVGQRILIPVIEGVNIDQLNRIENGSKPQPSPEPPPARLASVPEPAPEIPAAPVEPPQAETSEPANQVTAYRQNGIAMFNEHHYADAIVEFEKVLNAVPHDADAITYISRAYVQLGKADLEEKRIDEARIAFTKALEYDENCRPCQDLLNRSRTIETDAIREEGERLLKEEHFDEAIAKLERVSALNPKDSKASDLLYQCFLQKALMLYKKQDYLAAGDNFRKAAAANPDCADCDRYIKASMEAYKDFYYNEGIEFFGQEELKKAISSWQKVVAVDPDYKDVQQHLNKAMLLNDRLERIRKNTTKVE